MSQPTSKPTYYIVDRQIPNSWKGELLQKSFRRAKIRDLYLLHKTYNHLVYQYNYTCFHSLGHGYFFSRYPYFGCLWYWLLSTKIKVKQNKRYWNKKQSFIHSHWYVFDNWSAYIALWKEFWKIVRKIEILMFYSLLIQSIFHLKPLKISGVTIFWWKKQKYRNWEDDWDIWFFSFLTYELWNSLLLSKLK